MGKPKRVVTRRGKSGCRKELIHSPCFEVWPKYSPASSCEESLPGLNSYIGLPPDMSMDVLRGGERKSFKVELPKLQEMENV
jgi:hypothetical protein